MKAKNFLRSFIMAACMLALATGHAQVTFEGNNSFNSATDFVGWDNTVTNDPLMIKHEANQPIEWYTNAVRRMLLQQDATYTVGGFASQIKDGSLLLSPDVDQFYSIGGPGPFSLLHLAAATNNAQDNGYRPWMRNGINFTGNNDQMYIGHKYTTSDLTDPGASILSDYSDAVIQWSDNPGTWLGDRMRFIFTSEYSSSTNTGNSSLEGLEAMQLFPVENGSEVHVGIGDWYGASAQPEERLDVLDRTIRVRELPTDYEDVNKVIEKVVVTDDNGRLHWRPIEDFAGQTDCDWYIDNANEVVATAWTGGLSCNDEDWKVKIGQDPGSTSAAKLTPFRAGVRRPIAIPPIRAVLPCVLHTHCKAWIDIA
ncbi:MAG: hypothetical protein KDB88_02320 [Flavobacteriales bacterium]|nr:hypothetical protein [Flavobacteriales bacterium]